VKSNWRKPWATALFVGMHLLAHLVTALVLIAVISLAQAFVRDVGDPRLLDFLPIRYIFDLMDLALLAQFLYFGTLSAYNAFREAEDE
jgi:hypothetical protein